MTKSLKAPGVRGHVVVVADFEVLSSLSLQFWELESSGAGFLATKNTQSYKYLSMDRSFSVYVVSTDSLSIWWDGNIRCINQSNPYIQTNEKHQPFACFSPVLFAVIPRAESRISSWRPLFLRSSARWTVRWPCSQSGTVEALLKNKAHSVLFNNPQICCLIFLYIIQRSLLTMSKYFIIPIT